MNWLERCSKDHWPWVGSGLVFSIALFLGSIGVALAADRAALLEGMERYSLGPHLSYLEDKKGDLSLDDLVQGEAAQRFTPVLAETANFGFRKSAYWFRVNLENLNSPVSEWFLETQYSLLDQIDTYLVYSNGKVVSTIGGDTLAFSQRALKHRHFTSKVLLARGESVAVFLRVKSEGAITLPLVLWSMNALLAKDHEEQYALGIYYGVLVAMLCFNLMIFIAIRDISYLYYLYYLGGWILMQMSINGLAFEYLWPDHPRWGNIATPFFLGILISTIIQFVRAFLQIKKNLPKFDLVCRIYLWLGVLITACAFFLPYSIVIKSVVVIALTESVAIFIAGGICLKRGVRQAKYFMLAWSVLLVGNVMYIMQNWGVLPTVFITEYGLQIGSALEVVLLSFALAHRMRILKEENERIQWEATETLELRVKHRTQELGQALKDLSEASDKLKDLSHTDGLTGAKNRAHFNEKLDAEWQRALRSGRSIGLLMIDIDHFKHINDTYGHLVGDACLKQVARTIGHAVRRATDDSFRYGGEEFVVMLPGSDLHGALGLGEAIRGQVEALALVFDGVEVPLTISVGVACVVPDFEMNRDALIGAADSAMYQAKRNGRNRVCVNSVVGQVAGA